MNIQKNFSLKKFNTFGIDVQAQEFVAIKTLQDLIDFNSIRDLTKEKFLILGGGSNILFTKNFDGLVLKIEMEGIKLIKEDSMHVWVKVGSGVAWHDFVMYSIDKGWAGLENLSLIPGTVGAAPIQNIGAYGVEVKDVITEVIGMDFIAGSIKSMNAVDCKFDYRTSIFKSELKHKFLITEVVFQLKKHAHLKITYGAIREVLSSQNIFHPTIQDVSNAVINIRRSKLPNPKDIGNAGSFFKNPVVSKQKLETLQSIHSNIVFFPFHKDFKLAAGWLIEQAGWKGFRAGNVGCYEKQALVLVNFGNASGGEILSLAEKIQQSVFKKFQVELELEVHVI